MVSTVYMQLFRGATALTVAVPVASQSEPPGALAVSAGGTGAFVVKDTPGAGTFTYSVKCWSAYTGSAGGAFSAGGITLLEVKK